MRLKRLQKKLDNFSHLFSFKKAIFIAFFVLQTIQISAQKSQFKDRYIWVVRSSLVTENSIDRMIEYAVINRFNNIIVQVRGRGDAYYNSVFVPKSSLIKNLDFDPLAYLIPIAKQKGLKVHVWVNTYLLILQLQCQFKMNIWCFLALIG